MPATRIIISGLVQGVFFRAQAKEQADALGITGWVRNNNDGSVEIHGEGSDDMLNKLTEWCRTGPEKAVVKNVTVTVPLEQHSPAFEIWY